MSKETNFSKIGDIDEMKVSKKLRQSKSLYKETKKDSYQLNVDISCC